MRKRLAVAGLLLLSAAAFAENFGARFDKGYAQLRAGDPDAALASFNELLTETPDSELVRYSIAAAEYGKGVKDLENGQTETGVQGLNHARASFEALRSAETPFVREQAGFGSANCAAQLAEHYNDGEQYQQRLQALQDAVAGYENVLQSDPKHAGATTNLNHTRYLLKKMLQNPPQNDKKSKDNQGDQGQNGEQNQQGDQNQEQQQPPDDQQQQDKQDQDNDQKPGDPKDQKSTAKSTEEENIQAILDSLEDKNRQEQKNLRKAKGAPKVVDGKWW